MDDYPEDDVDMLLGMQSDCEREEEQYDYGEEYPACESVPVTEPSITQDTSNHPVHESPFEAEQDPANHDASDYDCDYPPKLVYRNRRMRRQYDYGEEYPACESVPVTEPAITREVIQNKAASSEFEDETELNIATDQANVVLEARKRKKQTCRNKRSLKKRKELKRPSEEQVNATLNEKGNHTIYDISSLGAEHYVEPRMRSYPTDKHSCLVQAGMAVGKSKQESKNMESMV
jgi:hypothetical protein